MQVDVSVKKSRNDLTLRDKVKALEALDKRIPQTEVAKCFECSQSQISRIASRRESIRALWMHARQNQSRKRIKKNYDIESKLRDWFCNAVSENTSISVVIMKDKAREIAREFNRPSFVPTDEWLQRWKDNFEVGSRFRDVCEGALSGNIYGIDDITDEQMTDSKLNILGLVMSTNNSNGDAHCQRSNESRAQMLEPQAAFQNPMSFDSVTRDETRCLSVKIKEEPIDEPEMFFKLIEVKSSPNRGNTSNEEHNNISELSNTNRQMETGSAIVNPLDSYYRLVRVEPHREHTDVVLPNEELKKVTGRHFRQLETSGSGILNINACNPTIDYRVEHSEMRNKIIHDARTKKRNVIRRICKSNTSLANSSEPPSSEAALEAISTIRTFLEFSGHENFMCLDDVEDHVNDCIRSASRISCQNKI